MRVVLRVVRFFYDSNQTVQPTCSISSQYRPSDCVEKKGCLFVSFEETVSLASFMADYVSIDEFNNGWTFFIKKIKHGKERRWGTFPCSDFSCSETDCNDWLDCDNQNRNVIKFKLMQLRGFRSPSGVVSKPISSHSFDFF